MSGSEKQLRGVGKLCMCLIAKVIRISHAKFHCSRLTTVQDTWEYASLIFWHTLYMWTMLHLQHRQQLEGLPVSSRVQSQTRICLTMFASAKTSCRRYWSWHPTSRQQLSRMLKRLSKDSWWVLTFLCCKKVCDVLCACQHVFLLPIRFLQDVSTGCRLHTRALLVIIIKVGCVSVMVASGFQNCFMCAGW